MFSFCLDEKIANKQWIRLTFSSFGFQQTILHHPQSSVANRSNFVIFLILLLWGDKSKERVVFLSLTNCFLYEPEDYLNCSPSGPLPPALSALKSIVLILSTVRIYLSPITHINYFIS